LAHECQHSTSGHLCLIDDNEGTHPVNAWCGGEHDGGSTGGGDLMTGADTNRWRPGMLDGEPGASAEAARRSAREVFDRWIRRFLWLGLTRTSARLRNVTGSEGPIRARARLESARIEEKYHYQQEISLNPSSEISCKPTGRIKLVL